MIAREDRNRVRVRVKYTSEQRVTIAVCLQTDYGVLLILLMPDYEDQDHHTMIKQALLFSSCLSFNPTTCMPISIRQHQTRPTSSCPVRPHRQPPSSLAFTLLHPPVPEYPRLQALHDLLSLSADIPFWWENEI